MCGFCNILEHTSLQKRILNFGNSQHYLNTLRSAPSCWKKVLPQSYSNVSYRAQLLVAGHNTLLAGDRYLQNAATNYLVILLNLREVPSSNFGPKTGYQDCKLFSWSSSVSRGKSSAVSYTGTWPLPHILNNSLPTVWATDSVVK
jgi:hypothetical protein